MQSAFLAKLKSNGQLDESFRNKGAFFDDLSGGYVESNAIVLQKVNGKERVLIAGMHNAKFVIAAYSLDGSEDYTFGDPGKHYAQVDFLSGIADHASAIIIDKDNKIYCAGVIEYKHGSEIRKDICSTRLTESGKIDKPLYSGDGKSIIPFYSRTHERLWNIDTDSDGNYYFFVDAANTKNTQNDTRIEGELALAKLDNRGKRIKAFSGDSKYFESFKSVVPSGFQKTNARLCTGAYNPVTKKLVVMTWVSYRKELKPGLHDIRLAIGISQHDPKTGKRDTQFGDTYTEGGLLDITRWWIKLIDPFLSGAGMGWKNYMVIDKDSGDIYMSMPSKITPNGKTFNMVRKYDKNGKVDRSYGLATGTAIINRGSKADTPYVQSMALDSQKRIIIAGSETPQPQANKNRLYIARFDKFGHPDKSFHPASGDGQRLIDLPWAYNEFVNGVATDSKDNIYLTGINYIKGPIPTKPEAVKLRLKVTLTSVKYEGDDIGNDWILNADADFMINDKEAAVSNAFFKSLMDGFNQGDEINPKHIFLDVELKEDDIKQKKVLIQFNAFVVEVDSMFSDFSKILNFVQNREIEITSFPFVKKGFEVTERVSEWLYGTAKITFKFDVNVERR